MAQETTETSSEPALSANAAWIVDMYDDTLGRVPADSEIDFWVGRLAGGGADSREQVARSFVFSPEGSAIEVERAYLDLLDRSAESGGLAFWTDFLQQNPVTVLRSNLISSQEYFDTAGGSNASWLNALYLQILERPVDASGLQYWDARLRAGETRWIVVWSIYLSAEALENRADAYADEILGRPLTPGERVEAVALIRAQDERAFRARLLASDEAFAGYLDAVGLLTGERS